MKPIEKLTKCWKEINKREKEMIDSFSNLLLINYKKYRDTISKVMTMNVACIPINSLILRDLTMIEEMSTFTDNGTINMVKFFILSKVLGMIHTFTKIPYSHTPLLDIQHLISHPLLLNEDELYELSHSIIQRDNPDKSPGNFLKRTTTRSNLNTSKLILPDSISPLRTLNSLGNLNDMDSDTITSDENHASQSSSEDKTSKKQTPKTPLRKSSTTKKRSRSISQISLTATNPRTAVRTVSQSSAFCDSDTKSPLDAPRSLLETVPHFSSHHHQEFDTPPRKTIYRAHSSKKTPSPTISQKYESPSKLNNFSASNPSPLTRSRSRQTETVRTFQGNTFNTTNNKENSYPRNSRKRASTKKSKKKISAESNNSDTPEFRRMNSSGGSTDNIQYSISASAPILVDRQYLNRKRSFFKKKELAQKLPKSFGLLDEEPNRSSALYTHFKIYLRSLQESHFLSAYRSIQKVEKNPDLCLHIYEKICVRYLGLGEYTALIKVDKSHLKKIESHRHSPQVMLLKPVKSVCLRHLEGHYYRFKKSFTSSCNK